MTASASDTAPVSDSRDTFILDSYALLAFLRGEVAGRRVADHLRFARNDGRRLVLLSVSLGEVMAVVERRSSLEAAKLALSIVNQLPVEILATDSRVALRAAHLKVAYRLHYMEALVAALAQMEQGTVLTGDPDYKAVESVVPIEWLGG